MAVSTTQLILLSELHTANSVELDVVTSKPVHPCECFTFFYLCSLVAEDRSLASVTFPVPAFHIVTAFMVSCLHRCACYIVIYKHFQDTAAVLYNAQ